MSDRFHFESVDQMLRYQPKQELVSIVAYLIGVPKRIFENVHEPPKIEYYKQLDQNRKARIIRNLCILRTDFQRNFSRIFRAFGNGRDIWSMKDWLSIDLFSQLENDGCRIYRQKRSIHDYICVINQMLSDRLGNIKEVFPSWLKWEYIRSIFLLPADYKYKEMRKFLPYQCCINLYMPHQGNILYNDEKFVTLLYESFEDSFQDLRYVRSYENVAEWYLGDLLKNATQPILAFDGKSLDIFQLTKFWLSLPPELAHCFSKVLLFCQQKCASYWSTCLPAVMDNICVISIPEEKPESWHNVFASQLLDAIFQDFFECDLLVMLSDDSACLSTSLEILDNPEITIVCISNVEDSEQLVEGNINICPLADFLPNSDVELLDFSSMISQQFEQLLAAEVHLNMKDLFAQLLEKFPIKPDGPHRQELYTACVDHLDIRIDDNGNLIFAVMR